MKAIHLTEFVEPDQIKITEVEKPERKRGEALIKVKAAGLNPSDVKNAQGVMKHHTELPRTIGRDYSGIVEEGPADWIGKEVWGGGGDLGFTRDGSYAEYIVVPTESLSEKPKSLSFEQAAGAGIPFITGYAGLVRLCEAGKGESVLIIGASGSVGTSVAQMAKWLGARVIGTARNANDKPSVPMAVVNLETEDLPQAVENLTKGKGVNVCFNAVGGETFTPALKSLAISGRMVCLAATGEREVKLDLLYFYRHQLKLYGLDTLQYDSVACAEILESIKPGFEEGSLQLPVPEVIKLENVEDAFQRVAKGEIGKKVLVP
ncbi:MAG TPA: zinc-binding alcohol dehydrogenase family protein [Fimbriimonadaceae bacterium]|jgi:NADPH:quinone reductase-like Zn-dependent oxidoreductase